MTLWQWIVCVVIVVIATLGAAWAISSPVTARERREYHWSPARALLSLGVAMALLGAATGLMRPPMWTGVCGGAVLIAAGVYRAVRVGRWV